MIHSASTFEKNGALWRVPEILDVTGGKLRRTGQEPGEGITGLSIDTRTLSPGDLFIALKGGKADGHEYVRKAFEKGAAAALVSQEIDNAGGPVIVVEDTLAALEAMARKRRSEFGGLIVAVTGSVGKTGTKEMLSGALGSVAHVYAAPASFNNHIGVPYALASIPHGTDIGIIEIGMNHAGEIAPLSLLAQPDIAIITTIEEVHIENFDGLDGIAQAKAEIFTGMGKESRVILNADNPYYSYLVAKADEYGLKGIYSFGGWSELSNTDKNVGEDLPPARGFLTDSDFGGSASKDPAARLLSVVDAANGLRMTATVLGKKIDMRLHFSGVHQARNALSVLLASELAGYDSRKAAAALQNLSPMAGRGSKETLDYGHADNPVILIDESYNASPVAMQAAFKVLALIDPGRGGRRIAVLGDMLELGQSAVRHHRDLALPLKAANIDFVYTCGTMMEHLHQNLPANVGKLHKKNSRELAEIVPEAIVPGDVVMVKGSYGSDMRVVVEALRQYPARRKVGGKNKATEKGDQ